MALEALAAEEEAGASRGLGEVGKSTLCSWLAAPLSTGGTWPDGTAAPKAKTLFLLAEDDLADTLRPRLDRQGADVAQIHHLDAVKEPGKGRRKAMFNLARHVPLLEAIKQGG
ncbi:MAG: AAA family ATPase [Actinomycetota bacterium]|nr:AAA family ATPase [Actinomycetota bacterium]